MATTSDADVAIFGRFLGSNYEDIFAIEKDIARVDPQCLPELEMFYKRKYFLDHELVTVCPPLFFLPVQKKTTKSFYV